MYTTLKCFYTYLAWRWPTCVDTCCFNEHQIFWRL